MINDYYTIMTQTGQTKLIQTAATGNKLHLTTFALGDGAGASYDPVESQSALKNEVYRADISNLWIEDNNTLAIDATIPPEAGGWIVRELGIYDTDGDLIAIAKTPDDPKPGPESGIAKEITYQLYVAINNVNGLEIAIDPTVAIATKAEVQAVAELVGGVAHYTSFADINAGFASSTALNEVIAAMADNGILRAQVMANNRDYPIAGMLEIIKYDTQNAACTLSALDGTYQLNISPDNQEQVSAGAKGLWRKAGSDSDLNPGTTTFKADGSIVTVTGDITKTVKTEPDGSIKTVIYDASAQKETITLTRFTRNEHGEDIVIKEVL